MRQQFTSVRIEAPPPEEFLRSLLDIEIVNDEVDEEIMDQVRDWFVGEMDKAWAAELKALREKGDWKRESPDALQGKVKQKQIELSRLAARLYFVLKREKAYMLETLDPWDQIRMKAYVEFKNIKKVVNDAINSSRFVDKIRGLTGFNVDREQRYIYAKNVGWIDLQHVTSAAAIPWASERARVDLGRLFEYVQGLEAGRDEDYLSNSIGAKAYVRSIRKNIPLAEAVKEEIGLFEVLTETEALEFFKKRK